jgi:type I restriction enzyme S subunit
MSTPKEHTAGTAASLGLPSEWDEASLGQLFDVQQGKALSPQARQGQSPRPFLRTANVLWGKLDLETLDRMDFDQAEAERLALKDRDLLVCEGGEIGRTAIWRGEVPNCMYQNHIHRLRRKLADVEPEFVMYWMQAAFLSLRLFGGAGNKTTIPNLSAARLKMLFVPKPSPEEQRAIAGVLAKLQRAVELEDRRIAALKELKSAAMAKVFRDGLSGDQAEQTELSQRPRGWQIRMLGQLTAPPSGTIQTGPFGSQLHSSDYVAEGVPIVNPTHINGGLVVDEGIPRVRHSDADRLAKHRLRKGDILFSRRGDVGRHAYISDREQGWLCGTGCLLVRPADSEIEPLFLSYALETPLAQDYLIGHASGTIMPNINTKILSSVPVPVAPTADQVAIAHMLAALDGQIRLAHRHRQALATFFDSALNQFMTGQLRVTPLLNEEAVANA